MRTSSILLSEYSGSGNIRFYNGLILKGNFTLKLYTGGFCNLVFKLMMETQINEFRLLNELVYADLKYRTVKRKNFEASFSGISNDHGRITINWMSLDNTHIDFTKINTRLQYSPVSGNPQINPFEAVRNATVLEGSVALDFIVGSEVEINYNGVGSEESVSTFIGITNFIFRGQDSPNRKPPYYIKNALLFSVQGEEFEFVNIPQYHTFVEVLNYDDFMKQLKSKESDVTCECISMRKFKDLPVNRNELNRILYILSFATCNWLATLYENTYKGRKLIRTVLLPHKTFKFVGGQYSINPTATNVPLKRLVESGYPEYWKLEDKVGLKYLIEDYVMSPREGNLEAKYMMLAVAMETLASYATGLAKSNGKVVPNITRLEKEKKILETCKKMKISVSDQFIEGILGAAGFNDIRLKDKLRYIFGELSLSYTDGELSEFIKYRNIMFHAGISRNTKKLSQQWHNLANLFDRFMLTLLGWKNNIYVDKSKDYIELILH